MPIGICDTICWLTSPFTGNEALNNLASLFTIGVIIITPLTYFTKRWIDNRSDRAEVSRSLHAELKDALDALDGTSKRQVMEIEINNVNKYYTLVFMNYDMYDSFIFSGQIKSLNHNLQQQIQDIFRQIKKHKEYLELTIRLNDMAVINNHKDIRKITDPYYNIIADYESELEEKIPKMMKELEKNF
jgi:hypothetical protein